MERTELSIGKLLEYFEAFQVFDRDEDNLINMSELETVLRVFGDNPTQDMVEEMIDELEVDDDKCVSFAEFLTVLATQEKSDVELKKNLKKLYEKLDTGGNGFIEKDELAVFLVKLGVKKEGSLELAESMITIADIDKDGKLSYDEFEIEVLKIYKKFEKEDVF